MTEQRSGALVDIESAAMTVYRLYSVGDEIDLDVAERCLAQWSSTVRVGIVFCAYKLVPEVLRVDASS
jgi:hypothetical protein